MSRLCYALTFLIFIGCATAPSAQAQYQDFEDLRDLREILEFMGESYADGYLQPVTDAFGANMNSGFFRDADVDAGFLPLIPVSVYVGVSVSGVPTGSLNSTFTPPGSETLPDGSTIEFEGDRAPTVVGSTDTPDDAFLVLRDEDGDEIDRVAAPPGLISASIAPLVVPQAQVGSIFGTDLLVRYFPTTTLSGFGGSYGRVGLSGVAVRHDINQWIPVPIPLKIAVQGAWNNFTLENEVDVDGSVSNEEVIDATSWALNIHASRSIPLLPFTFYGGLQFERFSTDYSYTFQREGIEQDISLSQTGANKTRALAGVSFGFTFLQINADYAIGTHNVFTVGMGLRL